MGTNTGRRKGKRVKFLHLSKVYDGTYLKNYELTYYNKEGEEKKYEMVSRREIKDEKDLGKHTSGVSIVAIKEDKMILLKEFRMAVNKKIYNLVAGMLEEGETIQQCIEREPYEETGLHVVSIMDILPPSFSAVAISDVKTNIVFAKVDGEISDHTSNNEEIEAAFYHREQLKVLLQTEPFSSRAQMAAYLFLHSHWLDE